jgi:hypothetical protein
VRIGERCTGVTGLSEMGRIEGRQLRGYSMRRMAVICSTAATVLLTMCPLAWPDYNGVMSEFFFGREPSARAAALGRGYVAIGSDGCAGFYNPAALSSAGGPSVCFSRSERYYLLDDAVFTFGYLSVPLGQYGTVGIGEYHFDCGEESAGCSLSDIALAYSLGLTNDLCAGLSVEHVRQEVVEPHTSTFTGGLGALWSRQLVDGSPLSQRASLAASISNLTYSGLDFGDGDQDLPVSMRVGAAYALSWSPGSGRPLLTPLEAIVHVEYLNVLNSDFWGGLRVGAELQILEILAVRIGHYGEKADDYGHESNKDTISQTTYGFGIQVPAKKINSRIPVTARFDFVSLDQPSFVKHAEPEEKYQLYTFSLQWVD